MVDSAFGAVFGALRALGFGHLRCPRERCGPFGAASASTELGGWLIFLKIAELKIRRFYKELAFLFSHFSAFFKNSASPNFWVFWSKKGMGQTGLFGTGKF